MSLLPPPPPPPHVAVVQKAFNLSQNDQEIFDIALATVPSEGPRIVHIGYDKWTSWNGWCDNKKELIRALAHSNIGIKPYKIRTRP